MSCVEPGCTRPVKVKARSMCNTHYKRAQKAGTLLPLDRFAPLVDQSGECWLWLGRLNKDGYGRYGGALAHRIAWTRTNGQIPAGMTIDHRCRVRSCVRPAHLRVMSPAANFSDNGFRDRTICRNGHPWDEVNTRVRLRHGRVRRVCRACERDAQRRFKARRRP